MPNLSKTSQVVGILSGIAAIGLAVYYLSGSAGGTRGVTAGGTRFRPLVQRRRDWNLGRPQANRKYFGWRGQSSAQGAGSAVGLPPQIGLYGSGRVQTAQQPIYPISGINQPYARQNRRQRSTVALAAASNAPLSLSSLN